MNVPSVLIVDDDDDDRYLLRRQLRDALPGAKVFEATDGEDALRFLCDASNREQHPDHFPPKVIFLDINMPRVDGFGFLAAFEKMRQDDSVGSSIIMMFTSSERDSEVERATAFEFVRDYLVKGKVSSDQLRDKIEEHSAEPATEATAGRP